MCYKYFFLLKVNKWTVLQQEILTPNSRLVVVNTLLITKVNFKHRRQSKREFDDRAEIPSERENENSKLNPLLPLVLFLLLLIKKNTKLKQLLFIY